MLMLAALASPMCRSQQQLQPFCIHHRRTHLRTHTHKHTAARPPRLCCRRRQQQKQQQAAQHTHTAHSHAAPCCNTFWPIRLAAPRLQTEAARAGGGSSSWLESSPALPLSARPSVRLLGLDAREPQQRRAKLKRTNERTKEQQSVRCRRRCRCLAGTRVVQS